MNFRPRKLEEAMPNSINSMKFAKDRCTGVLDVAVVGAGISGLIAARTLVDHGLRVTVFEKSRGVGGRMSTRRVDADANFDHGAQYFTIRDERFKSYIDTWMLTGLVARWPDPSRGDAQKIVVFQNGRIVSESASTERFVACPAMNSICKHLAADLKIVKQTRVATIETIDSRVRLADDTKTVLGCFDRVIVSTPAAQAAELLVGFPSLHEPISEIKMNPCWAAMVTLEKPVSDEWAGAFIQDSFLVWVARNSTKPGRVNAAEQLVIHAGQTWSRENWERDPIELAEQMLAEFWRSTSLLPQRSTFRQAHRWKYALAEDPSSADCFIDENAGIVACGDWASGSRVEGAFLSGIAAANRILGTAKIGI